MLVTLSGRVRLFRLEQLANAETSIWVTPLPITVLVSPEQ